MKASASSPAPVAEKSAPAEAPIATATPDLDSQIETLKKLKELLDDGVLSQEEFATKKRQVLGLLTSGCRQETQGARTPSDVRAPALNLRLRLPTGQPQAASCSRGPGRRCSTRRPRERASPRRWHQTFSSCRRSWSSSRRTCPSWRRGCPGPCSPP
ncbi:MAG: SHOCT domain-containing protein [Coriobacteriaceae bacterium]|nr:SHOCT domain-containing protein [Coriobacteriaceae bacterium]